MVGCDDDDPIALDCDGVQDRAQLLESGEQAEQRERRGRVQRISSQSREGGRRVQKQTRECD